MSNLDKPAAFDPAAAVNAIRDKIRGAMLDVIPTEQWDAMIKAEMHTFMNDHTTGGQHYQQPREAGFKAIVRSMLEQSARERVKALLDSPEWKSQWCVNGRDQQAGEAVQKYLTENAAEILNKWVSGAVQQVLTNIQYVSR